MTRAEPSHAVRELAWRLVPARMESMEVAA
jgi:hypothetical protein